MTETEDFLQAAALQRAKGLHERDMDEGHVGIEAA
jgi:hypothetical protein